MVGDKTSNLVLLVLTSAVLISRIDAGKRNARAKPNFVVFFADDMGYGDLASYGHPTQERGPVDDIMVKGGIKFTQAYVPDSVCSPSRAALLTGRYPVRTGVYRADGELRVFLPWTSGGLPHYEITIAEALKDVGYTTGMVGKWHLGINNHSRDDGVYLPMNQGFDFVGHFLPFTNAFGCDDTGRILDTPSTDQCILMKRDRIVAQPFNHTYLTQTFLNDALSFIDNHSADPFFFYFPFAHVHTSMFASPQFAGKSRRGEFGDNVNEMNWAVGEVIDTLERNGIAENTLVLFISDHGPEPESCAHGGDEGIFKGYKTHSWEGGVRVPFVAYWPGTITPRDSDAIVSTLDIIRTLVDLAGGSLPGDRSFDGEIITDVLINDAESPHDVLYFYCGDRLMAARSGSYKVHYFTQRVRTRDYFAEQCSEAGLPITFYHDCGHCYDDCVTEHDPPLIFNVEVDPIEAYALNASLDPALASFMADLRIKVAEYTASFVPGVPLIDHSDPSNDLGPCCDANTSCVCNFGPVTGPYNNYEPRVNEGNDIVATGSGGSVMSAMTIYVLMSCISLIICFIR